MKVNRKILHSKEKQRFIRYTKEHPPITWSHFRKVPKLIRHRIEGDLEISYEPKLIDDLQTGITNDVDEDQEIRLEDPGGPRAKSQKTGKEDVKEFLERHSNGELTEQGLPRGESVVIFPEANERARNYRWRRWQVRRKRNRQEKARTFSRKD